MKPILVIGDPHFQTNNVQESNDFMTKLFNLNVCKTKSVEAIVVLGDLLHTHERLHTTPLNLVSSFIQKLSNVAPTYVLVGNHDYINNQQYLTKNHWMNTLKHLKNVTIVDYPKVIALHSFRFLFMPYVPNGRFMEAMKELEPVHGENYFKSVQCIFAHQEFKGCKLTDSLVSSEGDVWDVKLPYVISGHIHKNHTLHNIYYPGTAMQHTFGEDSKHIIALVHFSEQNKKYDLDEIDLNLRKKITVNLKSIDAIKTYKHDSKSNHKIRLILECSKEDFKRVKKTKKFKELVSQNVKIVFKQKLKQEVKITNDYDFSTILDKLVKDEKSERLLSLHQSYSTCVG